MIKIKISGNPLKELESRIKSAQAQQIDKAVEALKEATPVDTGNARDGWRYENGAIVNDVEYIDRLNQGTSQQAPAHFIERTLLAQEGISPSGTIVRSS